MTANFLAIDIGASSGRVILGQWDGAQFSLSELHRFANAMIERAGHLHWDVGQLWREIQAGIVAYAAQHEAPLAGIGIDTWAVDYGLLDETGQLLGMPYAYRDARTVGVPEFVDTQLPPEQLYEITGIQRLPFNTLYQLVAAGRAADGQLTAASDLLLMPDLFHYWLSGRKVAEYTNASTTMLLDARTRSWAAELCDTFGIPTSLLPPIVEPGTILGPLLPELRANLGLRHEVPIIAVGTHDTASAVAAVPNLDERSAYISSGTWSLVGIEVAEPVLSEAAQRLNFTNEGGVGSTIRLLKNVGGLWLLQECQRRWQQEGHSYSWQELIALAEIAPPFGALIDPDAPEFLAPSDMPATIRAFCHRSGQAEPQSNGAIVRCCLESLALKYRWVIEALAALTDRNIETLRVVGGGSQNALLCQFTADACGRSVIAGPAECTALGNMLVQAIATGYIGGEFRSQKSEVRSGSVAAHALAAGRQALAASVTQRVYTPQPGAWDAAFARFATLLH